jgi:hypothetical protein
VVGVVVEEVVVVVVAAVKCKEGKAFPVTGHGGL